MLRIETTANDVSFFKHHRKVEHRQGPPTREVAPVKKTIYSLSNLREILLGCNRRYLAHLSALDDFSAGIRSLARLTKPRQVRGRIVKGSTSSPLTSGSCCMRSGIPRATSPDSAVATCGPCYR